MISLHATTNSSPTATKKPKTPTARARNPPAEMWRALCAKLCRGGREGGSSVSRRLQLASKQDDDGDESPRASSCSETKAVGRARSQVAPDVPPSITNMAVTMAEGEASRQLRFSDRPVRARDLRWTAAGSFLQHQNSDRWAAEGWKLHTSGNGSAKRAHIVGSNAVLLEKGCEQLCFPDVVFSHRVGAGSYSEVWSAAVSRKSDSSGGGGGPRREARIAVKRATCYRVEDDDPAMHYSELRSVCREAHALMRLGDQECCAELLGARPRNSTVGADLLLEPGVGTPTKCLRKCPLIRLRSPLGQCAVGPFPAGTSPAAVAEPASGALKAFRHGGRGATRLAGQRIRWMAAEIARCMATAHELGVAHCDLKPDNTVVMSDGTLRVIDWGLSVVDDFCPRSNNNKGTSQTSKDDATPRTPVAAAAAGAPSWTTTPPPPGYSPPPTSAMAAAASTPRTPRTPHRIAFEASRVAYTRGCRAPEMRPGRGAGGFPEAADVYAFGCTVAQICGHGAWPKEEKVEGLQPEFLDYCLAHVPREHDRRLLRDLVAQATRPNPADRPSFLQLLEHPALACFYRNDRRLAPTPILRATLAGGDSTLVSPKPRNTTSRRGKVRRNKGWKPWWRQHQHHRQHTTAALSALLPSPETERWTKAEDRQLLAIALSRRLGKQELRRPDPVTLPLPLSEGGGGVDASTDVKSDHPLVIDQPRLWTTAATAYRGLRAIGMGPDRAAADAAAIFARAAVLEEDHRAGPKPGSLRSVKLELCEPATMMAVCMALIAFCNENAFCA